MNKAKNALLIVFTVAPLVVTGILLIWLPDTVITHYDSAGQADGRGSKYMLLITPLTTLLFAAALGTVLQKKSKNPRMVFPILLPTLLILNVLTYIFLILAYRQTADLSAEGYDHLRLIAIALGIFEIVVGNVMPKIKQNFVLGLRISWTLNNEWVWKKAHRFGGLLFMLLGLLTIILAALPVPGLWTTLIAVAAILFVYLPVVLIYAYRCHRKAVSSDRSDPDNELAHLDTNQYRQKDD